MGGRRRVDLLRGAVAATLLVVFVLGSILLTRHDLWHDFTAGERRSLAPQTRRILEGLDHPLRLTAFYADLPEEEGLLRELVDRFREVNPRLELVFVDPDRRPEVAEEYRATVNRTVIVENGELRVRTVAPGEAELIGAILRATTDRRTRVYFVEGHGEASVEDDSPAGIQDAAQLLSQQNFDLRTLQTKVTARIPADADLLVLASPEGVLTPREQQQLLQYMLGGGRLMAMLEPSGSSSADSVVARFGVLTQPGFVVDATPERRNLLGDGSFRFALALGGLPGHPITASFNVPVIFPLARGLRLEQPPPPGVDPFRLLETGAQSWVEKDLSALAEGTPLFQDGVDVPGPVGLAFAAEVDLRSFQLDPEQRETLTSLGLQLGGGVDFRAPSAGDSILESDGSIAEAPRDRARLVVTGDVDFINNANLRVQGNAEFFLAAMLWLAEQENRIALPARTDFSQPIVLTQRQLRTIRWGTLFLLPVILLAAGAMIAWRRRQWV